MRIKCRGHVRMGDFWTVPFHSIARAQTYTRNTERAAVMFDARVSQKSPISGYHYG